MSWGHPILALLLPLVVAASWLLQAWWRRRCRQRQRTVGAGLPHLTASVGRNREYYRSLMLWLGALFLSLALGAPRWGSVSIEQHQNGADVLLLLDCSRSMMTPDIYPTRMEAARRKALDLLEQAPELRLALMPFAAMPVLRCPFTGDHGALEQMLKDCSPDLFPADQGFQGTAIGAGVSEGLQVLSHGSERGQAILIMSDGADDDRDAVEHGAKAAHDAGIPVFGLFFGDTERKATLTIDGQLQTMIPDRSSLESLAAKTGGICVSAARDDSDVQALVQRIEKTLKLGPWESHVRLVQSERYQWPLTIALLLISGGMLLPTRRAVRAASRARPTVIPSVVRASALLLVGAGLLHAADPWESLSQALSDPPDHARTEIEALLLEHPAFYAAHYDLGTLLLDKDPAQAIAHLRAATVAPDVNLAGDSYLNLALALLNQGRLDESMAAAASAMQVKPALRAEVDQLRAKIISIKDEARRTAEEEARKLHITTGTLPPGTVGEPYHAMLSAAGGSGKDYRFDPLPSTVANFTLDADGTLHGTPDKVGSQEFSITVHDTTNTATKTLPVEILPPPEILPERLPEGIVGQPYHADLAEHGLTNAIWTASGLPAGITLSEIGAGDLATLDGQPRVLGTSEVTISASDGARQAKRTYPLVVSDSFAPDVLDLPDATAGAPYHFRPGVRGPAVAYTWSMSTAVDGLQMASDGTVTGIPQTEGPISLPIAISASDGRSRNFDLRVRVNPPPVINEEKPVEVTADRPVRQSLHVKGGTPPYQWHLADGTLPAGLRLEVDGTVQGATMAVGDAVVTVALEDRWQAAAHQRITITVKSPPANDSKQAKDPSKPDEKDQQDQQSKDQAGKDQQGKDQQGKDQQSRDQASQDQSGKDQSGKDQSATNPSQDQQAAKDQASAHQPSAQPKSNPDQSPETKADSAKDQASPGNPGNNAQKPDAATPAAADASAGAAGTQGSHADPARAAAVRWLEALPEENHDALRRQLLHESHPPAQKGNPW